MYITESEIRVRYGETDKMGYVYYGNYPLYYEVARTDMIKKLGLSYSKMEESGIIMPVASLSVKYIRPAFYDDLLTIKCMVKNLPEMRIVFEYEVFNEQGKLINTGETVLVFVDNTTKKPTQIPSDLLNELKKHF